MKKNIINLCMNSQDYRDICYMIDMVEDTEVRVDVIKKLGYSVKLVNFDNGLKSIIKTSRNELLIQITPKIPLINKTRCVIFKKMDFKKWS